MSEEMVKFIFEKGEKSLKNFACRLFSKYFSNSELESIKTSSQIDYLDPIRIGYIKSHLQDRKGGQLLSEQEWSVCRNSMMRRVDHVKLQALINNN